MRGNIVFFSGCQLVCRRLCEILFELGSNYSLVILKKQINSSEYASIISDYHFENIYVFDETKYGMITSESSRNQVQKLIKQFDAAYFPGSDTDTNVTVFSSIFSETQYLVRCFYGKKRDPDSPYKIVKLSPPTDLDFSNSDPLLDDKLFKITNEYLRISSADSAFPSEGGVTGTSFFELPKKVSFLARVLSSKSVVDIGCSIGLGTKLIAEIANRVTGIDYSATSIRNACKYNAGNNISFIQADLINTTVYKVLNNANALVAFEILEHFEEKNQKIILDAIHKNITHHAVIVGSLPDPLHSIFYNSPGKTEESFSARDLKRSYTDSGEYIYHKNELSPEELKIHLTNSGFENTKIYHLYNIFGKQSYQYINECITREQYDHIFSIINNVCNFNVTDFVMTNTYIPGFTSASFLFVAEKRG